MIRVPETVRAKAVAAGAVQWLDDLPSLVAGLEQDLVDHRRPHLRWRD